MIIVLKVMISGWRWNGKGTAGVPPVTATTPQKLISPAFAGTLNGAHT